MSKNNDKLTEHRRENLSPVERADIAVIEAARPALMTQAGEAYGNVGKLADEPPLLVLSGAITLAGLLTRRPALTRAGIRMLAAHTIAIGIKTFGKNRVNRTRPDALLEDGEYRMTRGHSKKSDLRSFPSGHSAGAFAVAKAASRELGHPGSLYGGAIAMALGQVFRRAHWPSDIVTGALVGVLAETVSRPFTGLVAKRI